MMYFVLKTGVYEWKGMETIMYKCCIFDLDGTLVNSIHAIQRSVDLSLEKWGMRKITVDECRVPSCAASWMRTPSCLPR